LLPTYKVSAVISGIGLIKVAIALTGQSLLNSYILIYTYLYIHMCKNSAANAEYITCVVMHIDYGI